ncbi:hypothetical protein F2Q69_00029605 [Brassica cretica]|uniref:Uncharacterized protein n=1 Tax=Brassica cretica TaxID=69181 RepID=A0A8S9RQC4_BRACR|nr:hypothetical protein F2Q69_00029605 [Brassica cretica]
MSNKGLYCRPDPLKLVAGGTGPRNWNPTEWWASQVDKEEACNDRERSSADFSRVADEKSFKEMKGEGRRQDVSFPAFHSHIAASGPKTQQVIARLGATDEIASQIAYEGVNAGEKQRSKRNLISLVDLEEDSDVEITPTTQTTKPRRQTSFGTACRNP